MSDTMSYYLHVDLVVEDKHHQEFEQLVTEFLNRGGFDRVVRDSDDVELKNLQADTKRLRLALRSLGTFEYKPAISLPSVLGTVSKESLTARRYVHVWRVPRLQDLDLARLMRACALDSLYRELDGFVLEESQDFVVRVRTPPVTPTRPYFVRSIRRFASEKLGEYLFDSGALFDALSEHDYSPIGQFQSVTGTIYSVVEFWNTANQAIDKDSFETILRRPPKVHDTLINKLAKPCDTLPLVQYHETLSGYLDRARLKKAEADGQLDDLLTPPPSRIAEAAQ